MNTANETIGTAKTMVGFGKVVEALAQGKMARRSNWEKDRFIFEQVPSMVPKEIVPKMTSLPDSVKAEFEKRFNDPDRQIGEIYYNDQWAQVNSSNLITAYCPTVSDCIAPDWVIL